MIPKTLVMLFLLALPRTDVLPPGEKVEGFMESEAAPVESPGLAMLDTQGMARGLPYALEATEGTWTIELVASGFNPYLVVRDAADQVVAEDDDSQGRDNARVLLQVPEGGATYTVWVCALRLGVGPFEVRALEGDAPLPEVGARVDDPILFVESEWEEHGYADHEAVKCIAYRSSEHRSRRQYEVAIQVLEYALVQLDPMDPEHLYAEAQFRKLLPYSLERLGRTAEAIDCGLRAMELLAELPRNQSHASTHFNVALYMWQLSRFEEGLEVSRSSFELNRELVTPDSLEMHMARELHTSYLRVNGRWEEVLPGLPEPIVLRPGEPLEGEHGLNGRLYQITGAVDHDYSNGKTRCASIPFRVEQTGDYTIDLRSFVHDVYLVLRDTEGTVLAEDDDSRGLRNAQLTARLVAGETYLLEPTALHNGWGPYRVDLLEGRPEDLDPWERRERVLEEIDECLALADSWPVEHRRSGLVSVLSHAVTLQIALGRRDDVVDTRMRMLELSEENYGPDSEGVLHARGRYAMALNSAGRSLEAIPILEELRDELERRKGPEGFPLPLLSTLAWSRANRGDFERADGLFREHQRRIEREGGQSSTAFAGTLKDRASLLRRMGRWEEAVELYRTVVEWHESKGARDIPGGRPALAGALASLAGAQTWLGDLPGARRSYEDAVQLQELAFGADSFAVARSHSELAWILHREGELERAHEHWRRATETFDAKEDVDVSNLNVGAELLAATGEHERAVELSVRALEAQSSALARSLASLPEPMRLRRVEEIDWTRSVLLGATRLIEADRRAYELIAPLKSLVGRGLVESRASAQAALDPGAQASIRELQNVQSELSQAFYDGDERLVARLQERRVELEDELARATASSGRLREVRVDELASALPKGAVLVDLYVSSELEPVRVEDGRLIADRWWDEDQCSAWIVRAGVDEVTRVDLGPAGALREAAVDPAGALIAARGITPGEVEGEQRDHGELRRLLWDPIAPHVGNAPLVFVSTYGFLGAAPFEVLPREDGSFLVEDHTFVYLSDATSLLESRAEPRSESPSLLLVGDVDYDSRESRELLAMADIPSLSRAAALESGSLRGPGRESWSPLPFTASEVERVGGLFGDDGSTVRLTASEATEEALKRELSEHSYVHVATHGFFHAGAAEEASRDSFAGAGEGVAGLLPGLLSGLVLAGANAPPEKGRDDGLLTAEELTWLDLSECELVTLSACETGLGSARGGEGMIGLRRAFHHAGAKTVVASLWSVEDEATATLMDSFYRYLWVEGRTRADALRSAQLDLLRANREQHGESRPWTWGAFVLSGEWR